VVAEVAVIHQNVAETDPQALDAVQVLQTILVTHITQVELPMATAKVLELQMLLTVRAEEVEPLHTGLVTATGVLDLG
jgi:hypothetical protein